MVMRKDCLSRMVIRKDLTRMVMRKDYLTKMVKRKESFTRMVMRKACLTKMVMKVKRMWKDRRGDGRCRIADVPLVAASAFHLPHCSCNPTIPNILLHYIK
jgi:hypothetical protein